MSTCRIKPCFRVENDKSGSMLEVYNGDDNEICIIMDNEESGYDSQFNAIFIDKEDAISLRDELTSLINTI